jgi:phytoene dehydrogenase-like protein
MEAATRSAPPSSASSNGGAPGRGPRSYDAIVVGGGHNGLTTTAYLAKAGLNVVCLERRDILGGACVTEELWPGVRVSRCSYVVSMLQPKIVSDLQLERYGYRAIPLDPAYVSLTEEGPIFFFNEVENTAKSIARYSKHDAENYPKFEALMDRVARFVKPMMLKAPPALGSKAPGDLAALLREAGRMAGFSQREIHELVRVFTMSVGDLLDDYFELDGLKGSTASSGVVGVWAGPRTPGTAYNLLHHALGECGGIEGAWGQVIGGMGAISNAIAQSAKAAGAEIRTGADVVSIDVQNGRAIGVTLADGSELRAPIVASGAHPKTTVLELAGRENFPAEVAEEMDRYRTRGASVKVNLLLSEAPVYDGVTDSEQQLMRTAGVNICPSIDYLERAWQDACLGKPAEHPYVEAELPSAVDTTLTDDGRWVMTMFTQYGPSEESQWQDGDRERYGETCIEQLTQFAPNLKDSVLEYEVLAPPDLERIFGLQGGSIFQGEQGLDQMAFMRPHPEMAQYATPVDGLYLCGAGTHPGGGVTGCSGHNAAHRILKDRKRARRPWRRVRASA